MRTPVARLAFVAALLAFLALGCSDDSPASSDAASIDAAAPDAGDLPITARYQPLAEAIEAERVMVGAPGVAALVLEDGKVTFAHGFGKKHPDKDDPVLATTLFRIGSVTKMLTATALLQLVAAGKANLDDPVTKAVPDFHFTADASWAPSIRLRHLLTHSSGMYDYIVLDAPAAEQEDAALASFMTGDFADVDYLMAPAGRMYNYSNPNYYLVGFTVEKLSGNSYRQQMHDQVFAPLEMKRTFFLPSEALRDGDFAYGATTDAMGKPSVVAPDSYENAWSRPAGFAFSSVVDLARFVRFLEDGNDAVLPSTERLAMQSPQIATEEFLDLVHYGYGLQVNDGFFLGGPEAFYRMRLVAHGGDIPGFAAQVFYVPELRFGFITLANTDGAHFVNSFVTALETLAPLPAPSEAPSLAVDPGTFDALTGTYQDDFNVGQVVVAKEGDKLTVSMPAVDAAHVPYEHELTPIDNRNFVLAIQGTQLQVTFLFDDSGAVEYLRTRVAVARKVTGMAKRVVAARPVDARRLARLLAAPDEARPWLLPR